MAKHIYTIEIAPPVTGAGGENHWHPSDQKGSLKGSNPSSVSVWGGTPVGEAQLGLEPSTQGNPSDLSI